jgi:hypothetical protein
MISRRPDIHLKHVFVESAPDELDGHTLYVSLQYASVIHRCCCGCGREVVTPLSPTDWSLTFDGVSISLWPSIGNWNSPCRSHYWIENSRVHWASNWSDERISRGRAAEALARVRYYERLGHDDQVSVLDGASSDSEGEGAHESEDDDSEQGSRRR